MRNMPGLTLDEKLPEHTVHVAGMAPLGQETGEMGAADQFGIGHVRASTCQAAFDTYLVQLVGDLLRAAATPFPQAVQTRGEFRVRRIDVQADDVQRLAVLGHRDLNAVDDLDALAGGQAMRFRDAVGFVVIGQRQDTDAAACRAPHQFVGAQHAVGISGMTVQVELAINTSQFNQLTI
jgi:hypothetical protein